jgi:hypothetical protein
MKLIPLACGFALFRQRLISAAVNDPFGNGFAGQIFPTPCSQTGKAGRPKRLISQSHAYFSMR